MIKQFRKRTEKQQTENEEEAPREHEVSINEIKTNTSWIQNFFHPNIYKVATVTFANGGDNIGVYIPFFTTYKG